MLQPRFDDLSFGQGFRQSVDVIDANLDGVAHASPVNGIVAVARLRHRSDVYQMYPIGIGLCLDGSDDVFHRPHVDLHGLLRKIIGCRRHHSAHV